MAVAHGRDARSRARDRFAPPVGGRRACTGSLKASRKTTLLHRLRPLPGYGAYRFRRACAAKRMPRPSRASPLVKRRRPPCACSVLSGGEPSASRSEPAVSTLIRKVPGLRRHRPGHFVREAAMTNAGPLAGTRSYISAHVFAAVMVLWQAAFRVAAHDAVNADPQGS
jgi:hypothetical protein